RVRCGFAAIRPKSARQKLLRTEKEIIFEDFSVQRRSNPRRVAIDDKPQKDRKLLFIGGCGLAYFTLWRLALPHKGVICMTEAVLLIIILVVLEEVIKNIKR
ncbi:MAG: hypothetical protein IJV48_07125, partial [Ruminococcus sp.]|nr:hypothetical protein [Ruminococcus sp.]